MKKKTILNLIKYHAEHNDQAFRQEAIEIAKEFDRNHDEELAEYIMSLLSDVNTLSPQSRYFQSRFFTKIEGETKALPLPTELESDIIGVMNAVNHHVGVNKFLFEGAPGTGKTESVRHIARILERDLYRVDFESVIDSKLGQTARNIADLFTEICQDPRPVQSLYLFDEIDSIAMDRVNSQDIREMGRATSAVLKGLDSLPEDVALIATTNLFSAFDKALIRRFDAVIHFNRYSKQDLIEIGESILSGLLDRFSFAGRDMRLFRKIMNTQDMLPYPGELKNILKTSVAFSDPGDSFSYLRKIWHSLQDGKGIFSPDELKKEGFTLREIEILTGISKSQLSRKMNG
ncbi:MAG TPA: AAA family ATPase [Veillonellaceae bacterium]|nr:AAA family ATPase [Veillonellaceae bacterium]